MKRVVFKIRMKRKRTRFNFSIKIKKKAVLNASTAFYKVEQTYSFVKYSTSFFVSPFCNVSVDSKTISVLVNLDTLIV